MIEFVTLLLGLSAGVQPVQLMAEDGVVAVELLVDQEPVARIEQAPWLANVDFGPELAPHVLDAVALDGSGKVIGRSRQWINVSPHQAKAVLLLETGREGEARVARVSWESLAILEEPSAARVLLDGEPLAVQDPRVIALPPYDPSQPHHLRVELEFGDSLSATAEVTFGGLYGEVVSTELTACPVILDKGAEAPSIEAIRGGFYSQDEPVAVHTVEKGPAEIVVVRDMGARTHLERLFSSRELPPSFLSLKNDHRLRFVSPCPKPIQRIYHRQLVFPWSPSYTGEDGSLLSLLQQVQPLNCSVDEQQLADAVAVAGLAAVQSRTRRAVVLVTTSRPEDSSQFNPEQVIRYLQRLRVPFEVWNIRENGTEGSAWSPAVNLSSHVGLSSAYSRLARRLDRQRIVWLVGLHLPQWIRLHPELQGLRLGG